ncbi:CBS domain-containing protein [Haloplanus vescus]|uniref:CBS domain-containing protein n=1 Tax=Haloplanus vescus TaxID=555874 RepID=A0A1H3Z5G3_9EURY|nr:CBS domain-containing protein [Haloplanus vescus]SEA18738.1 CBS domain-containing protein [Haloplanus vescus]
MFEITVETALTGYGETVSPTTSANEAAERLRDPDVPLLVVEDDGVEGVVTESDFVAMVAETTDPVPVSELMSDPPVAVSPTTPLETVVDEMRTYGVKQVLVVDQGEYWGFVSTESVDPHLADDTIEVSWNGSPTRIDASAGGAVKTASD